MTYVGKRGKHGARPSSAIWQLLAIADARTVLGTLVTPAFRPLLAFDTASSDRPFHCCRPTLRYASDDYDRRVPPREPEPGDRPRRPSAPTMATSVRSAVDVAQDIVRPYEDVKVAIDAKSAPRDDVESETWSGADHDPPILRRKVLAVFTHVHPSGLHEQGW